MKESLNRHIEQEALTDAAVGAYVLRETFPYFMSGRINDRSYAKPRGYAGDYWTIELLYQNEAGGDGRLGPHIDRWTLDLHSSQAVRNRRGMIRDLVREMAARSHRPGPVQICSLASGPAREIFDLLTADPPEELHATCLDIDQEAIRFAMDLAVTKGVDSRITFALENVVRLALGRGRIQVEPQDFIYSMGLIDYLESKLVVSLLDWAHDALVPGGTVALGNFALGSPDKHYLDHIGQWVLIHRTPDELRELFARSKFGSTPVEVLNDASGVQLLAVARKA
jgi:hypothetical protein